MCHRNRKNERWQNKAREKEKVDFSFSLLFLSLSALYAFPCFRKELMFVCTLMILTAKLHQQKQAS